MQTLIRRGRRVAVGVVLTGAVLTTMAIAGPAGASTTPAANHVILGSGSSTSYNMMQGLDTLFNDSLGCYMTQPTGTNQTLDFSCASNNEGNQVGEGFTENPVNDVAAEEPALGSSAGIDQIEYGGTGNDGGGAAEPTAVVNYARSSRQFKSNDYPGLNFVAYATDGVSWFTFPTVGGKSTASHGVKNLTTTQLTNIWSGKDKTWKSVGGTSTQNICVYVAQLSSGTESTWATALGFASPSTLNAYVDGLTAAPKNCKTPSGISYADSHTIFENEGQSIVQNGDEGNAIFFFSYGKYQVECAVSPPTSQCNNGVGSDKPYLGEINGITANPTTILCDTPACTTQFPVTRDLFNVYSNGSFSPSVSAQFGFPAATPATLNYVSEIGFLCKGQLDTSSDEVDDPSTGEWYHTEIANVITASGFIPFPLQTGGQDINAVDTPAAAVLAADGDTTYLPDDPITGSTAAANTTVGEDDPEGYCQVWTTDGNTAP
jgi:ABC-type phosphate transport system substrate-binding protein